MLDDWHDAAQIEQYRQHSLVSNERHNWDTWRERTDLRSCQATIKDRHANIQHNQVQIGGVLLDQRERRHAILD